MQIFLTGATGFVGNHILRRLLRAGHQVRALVRDLSAPRALALRKLSASHEPQLTLVEGDVVHGFGLEAAIAGCDAVIHLVGIIFETKGTTFERVHHQGMENVVRIAQAAGAKRFVQMSALGARADGVSAYQTSKYRGEQVVRQSGIPYVILRPSLIFGPGDGFVSRMVDVMESAPLIRPVAGSGTYRFRPIYVQDVGECFVQSLQNVEATGKVLVLVGGEELTLNELLEEIAVCRGVRKPAIHIPMPLMRLVARGMALLPLPPPVTMDQLAMLEEGSTADGKEMLQVFKIHPISFREGLQMYLCKNKAREY